MAFSHRRLEWLLRARGTDVAGWPTADRVAALELMRRSQPAQFAYAEALAREEDVLDQDRAVFTRMQAAVRRRIAPMSAGLRGLCVGALVACVMAGLYLASALPVEPHASADLFTTVQTVSLAAIDQ